MSATEYDTTRDMKQIKTRQGMIAYLPVKGRVAWLRADRPDARIVTEKVDGGIEAGWVEFKCTITAGEAVAVGHASETHQDFPDFYEKAETKAIGRACAMLGYGTEGARDFDDGEPLDGAGASKAERADRRMAPEERREVDAQHQRNTQPPGVSNIHQHAQLRSLAEHGYDLGARLAGLGVPTIEELSSHQAKELIIEGRASVRDGAPPAIPDRLARPSSLPATRNRPAPSEPNGQDMTRARVEAAMGRHGLPILPVDTYEEIAETVNRALANAGKDIEVKRDHAGKAAPGDILNALLALPSAVPA